MKVTHLKKGDLVIVRNGAKGEQVALVASVQSVLTARMHKWLQRGRRWTNRVTVGDSEVLRYATQTDLNKRRVVGLPEGYQS